MTLPSYIERGGGIVLRQPFHQGKTNLYAFVLDADHAALTALCEKYLSIGGAQYRPLGPFCVLAAADIERIVSMDSVDKNKGWIPERDLAFWVPVLGGHVNSGGHFVADRLAWFIPYIFVDNIAAMATGREIYGFPKEQGTLVFPASPADPIAFSVDAIALSTFTPTTKAEVKRVLELKPGPGAPLGPLQQLFATIEDAEHEIKRILKELLLEVLSGSVPFPSLALLQSILSGTLHERVTLAFLKQFRDAVDQTRACYQGIVEAPSTVTAFHGGGPLDGPFELTLNDYDSLPIRQELGLDAGTIKPRGALWLSFEFDVGNGTEVARTS